MPNRHRLSGGSQLELPFAQLERSELPPAVDADSLVALHSAVRLVLNVAEKRVAPSAEALHAVRASLGVLAAHQAGGRLGHVVRRYRAQPAAAIRWAELVDELAFVLSLAPTDGATPTTPTPGGLR